MLTFTRKVGQSIRIGESVKITVKEVRGRQVRMMIEAPRDVPIYREEIYAQVIEENALAAQATLEYLPIESDDTKAD